MEKQINYYTNEIIDELIQEEIIENYINKFVERTTVEERPEAKDKILYVVMNYLYENNLFYNNWSEYLLQRGKNFSANVR